MASKRRVRRMAGFLAKYATDDLLRRVVDPRSTRGRTWKSCVPLLKAVLLGLLSNCKGLGEVEELTAEMPRAVRKLLGIPRRIADTTMRDFLCQLEPESLGDLLYVIGYDAWRRKAVLGNQNFPWGVLSLDAKYPALRDTQPSKYLQVHHKDGEPSHGLLRMVTCTLLGPGLPVLGAIPVPGHTNEQGSFKKALGEMVRIYGRLFGVIMYDAGAASVGNADAVLRAGKHYFFNIADPRWVMYQMLELEFADRPPDIIVEEKISERKKIVRSISVKSILEIENSRTMWEHTKTAFKVSSTSYEDGVAKETLVRYYVTSLESTELSPEKWLDLVIKRWGVETCHQILDQNSSFQEDKRLWITSDAQGALAVMLMRRVAYTLLTLFRSVTQRSEENKILPFRKIMKWIEEAMKWPNEDFEGFRSRRYKVPPALA